MSFWIAPRPLILASRSAARRDMLKATGIPLEVIDTSVDERAVEAQAPGAEAAPDDVARLLAHTKALKGASLAGPGRYVVGADQTLALNGTIFHKAPDRAAAKLQLSRLQGHTHVLHSAVAVARDGEVVFEVLESAALTMRPLSEVQIGDYLDAAGPDIFGSVGCYQLESRGSHLFERIEGNHFTILGLPLLPLLGFLRQEGLLS
ncbi:Maf family protein [Aquabacter cavernae]|uniref:Maf family protein n=1 Tax=Aquabacter cavernae TaxID=2496029 RepID=UPI000F8E0C09|nr:nucleoside triphosphate pyrophosphatase [Aquabacter cavernae]